jgi:hypothetical protein
VVTQRRSPKKARRIVIFFMGILADGRTVQLNEDEYSIIKGIKINRIQTSNLHLITPDLALTELQDVGTNNVPI